MPGAVSLIWQGDREYRGLMWIGAGVVALDLYKLVATLQPDAPFRGILAAYRGIFVAGSLAWGVIVDKLRRRSPRSTCPGPAPARRRVPGR
jgi:small multidrug resistance family-3 protein